MRQSLELRLGQRLTMTPQLQQAIKLLQLSAIDLQTEIQHALDENPLLEDAGELDDEVSVFEPEEQNNGSKLDTELDLNEAHSEVDTQDDVSDDHWDTHHDLPFTSNNRTNTDDGNAYEIDARSSLVPNATRCATRWR